MNIIHLIPGLYLGGAEKVLELVYRHQIKRGHKVSVISFEKSGYEHFFSDMEVFYCNVTYQDSLFGSSGIKIGEYEDLIDNLSPDVIHSHSNWTDLVSHFNLRDHIHYISHFHLCYDFYKPVSLTEIFSRKIFRGIDRYRLLRTFRKSNCSLIASSDFIGVCYRQYLPKSISSKMEIMNNPVEGVGKKVKKQEIKYDLLSVGRLEEIKNHQFLLQIVQRAKENGIMLNLAIVGEGTLKAELQLLARQLHIEDLVNITGGFKSLTEIYSVSRIYIHSSHEETFGLSIFEAMAAGLPVIVKRFNGINEKILQHGFNAIIISGDDANDFARAVEKIKSDADLEERLISNGLSTVIQFSPENYLAQMDQLYRQYGG